MIVSVVVPAFNARRALGHSLPCIRCQVVGAGLELEALVVDDGSTDGTPELVKDLQRGWSALRLVSLARTQESSRARARNTGAAIARGDVIAFIDASVMIPPNWIAAAFAASQNGTIGVLGEIAGVALSRAVDLDPPVPEQVAAVEAELTTDLEWRDMRKPYFDIVDGEITRLPCYWSLGWSGAMILPKTHFQRVGGFDESFQGWGGEDVELTLRLTQSGLHFTTLRTARSIHWPHSAPQSSHREGMQRNFQRILALHPSPETEAFSVLFHHAIAFLQRMDTAVAAMAPPLYSNDVVELVRAIADNSGRVLVDQTLVGLRIGSTDVLMPHPRSFRGETARATHYHNRLGVALSVADKAIATSVVGNLLGGYPTSLLVRTIAELTRSSRRLLLVCTRAGTDSDSWEECSAWPALREQAVLSAAARLKVTARVLHQHLGHTVLEIA